jgi:hypothetical protein
MQDAVRVVLSNNNAPALHTGLLKFDDFVVLELQSSSTLIAMHEMHGNQ